MLEGQLFSGVGGSVDPIEVYVSGKLGNRFRILPAGGLQGRWTTLLRFPLGVFLSIFFEASHPGSDLSLTRREGGGEISPIFAH